MTWKTLLVSAVLMPATLPVPGPELGGPISPSNIVYEVIYDAAHARNMTVRIGMSFDVDGAGVVLLSLPAWTPGAYAISNYARNVSEFGAWFGSAPAVWSRADHDTWRISVPGAGSVRISFVFLADTLDNAMAWRRPDFLLLNGTNVFLYPEGIGHDFAASVMVRTEPGWRVATGLRANGKGGYHESSYHDLVDRPLFIGKFDYDSVRVSGRWHRLASYPAGVLAGAARREYQTQLTRMIPAMTAVFGEPEWDTYTSMLIFDGSFSGASALEHADSHVGIYSTALVGRVGLPLITAHEIIHAWNVKRMRPAELVPYRYDSPQPTPWLWVSEGITDYYADLTLVRSRLLPDEWFYVLASSKLANVELAPPVSLEDASLSVWVQARDGTHGLYYPKGSLAGLLLDILIRDASGNAASLDDVMRAVYESTYGRGRGFTGEDWWAAVEGAARGRSFAAERARYIEGRDPFPWTSVLPLAGMRVVTDSMKEARIGVQLALDSLGVQVSAVLPGSMAEAAGVWPGDYLLRLGDVEVRDLGFGEGYRRRYAQSAEGTPIRILVRRDGRTMPLEGELRFDIRSLSRIEPDPDASGLALRIREGILRGRTDSQSTSGRP